MTEENEKRKYLRLKPGCETYFQFDSGPRKSEVQYTAIKTNDLSASGISIECWERLMPGDILNIKLKFKAKKAVLKLHGQVVRCLPQNPDPAFLGPWTAGIKFLHKAEELAPYLIKYI